MKRVWCNSVRALTIVVAVSAVACSTDNGATGGSGGNGGSDGGDGGAAADFKVAWVLSGEKGDSGWTYTHWLGTEDVDFDLTGVEVKVVNQSDPECAGDASICRTLDM